MSDRQHTWFERNAGWVIPLALASIVVLLVVFARTTR